MNTLLEYMSNSTLNDMLSDLDAIDEKGSVVDPEEWNECVSAVRAEIHRRIPREKLEQSCQHVD